MGAECISSVQWPHIVMQESNIDVKYYDNWERYLDCLMILYCNGSHADHTHEIVTH